MNETDSRQDQRVGFCKNGNKPSNFVTAGNFPSSWMTSVQEKSVPFGFTTHHTISYSILLS